jgi:hypothetical protein
MVINIPGARYASTDPPIVVIDDFLTDEECEHIIGLGRPGLERSTGTGKMVRSRSLPEGKLPIGELSRRRR